MGRGVSIRGSVQRAVIALAFGAGLLAHAQSAATAQASLMVLASAKFPNLTRAERALLEFADVGTIARENEWAVGGTSAKLDDPSNDPRHAAEWGPERNIRASLIRWLCVDPDAVKMIDPLGIRILGARIVGPLNLFNTRVPFGLTLRRSVVVEPIDLRLAELATLDLGGSYTSSIDAESIHIHGDVDMRDGFHAAAEVLFDGAQIGGSLDCAGGTFVHSSHAGNDFWAEQRPALSLNGSRIDGAVLLCCGFHSDGAVLITGSTLSNLICSGGYFVNPGKFALSLDGSNVSGYAALGTKWANRPAPTAGPNSFGEQRQGLQADGVVFFANSKVGAFFRADGARFLGKSSEPHGLVAIGMSAGGIVWLDVDLQNGAELDLSNASSPWLLDDERSWPESGKLFVNGFTYRGLYEGSAGRPSDARSRLRWIALQSAFNPQPYSQLAKVLREGGDDAGATQVLITEEDLRYARYGLMGRLCGAFLKWTIGYGHRPLLTVLWSLAVVLAGWAIVAIAKAAGVMRLTWPETTVPPAGNPTAGLHPLLYSLDVFLPFVNLHQERYWWPDESASGESRFLGGNITIRGSILRYYLWTQIIAGWLLSAIFVAGVTGLMRND